MNTDQESQLVIRTDGTALHSVTGLVWMLPLVGQGWSTNVVQGNAIELSWEEATSRFGRARLIRATSEDCNWEREPGGEKTAFHQKYPLSRESYSGYTFGTKKIEFAGFNDWRMPTIEELWSIADIELDGIRSAQPAQVWTANPSTNGIFATIEMSYQAAWLFDVCGPHGFGDLKRENRYPVRLVRSGNIFKALY